MSWGDGAVTVDGVLPVPSPCYTATLADASYDGEADAVTVVVAAKSVKETCVQCLADASYTATVEFDGGLPSSAVVKHRSKSETKTVTTASR